MIPSLSANLLIILSEDNLVTEIIQKNAVEIDVPVSEIGSPAGAQGNSGSRVATSINNNREGGGVNVKIILPVCLLGEIINK